jgi:sulfur carrier protein
MQIFVNGDRHEVEPDTLAAALTVLGFGRRKIATALNGDFVPAGMRQSTRLTDGDRIEVVAPMQGG